MTRFHPPRVLEERQPHSAPDFPSLVLTAKFVSKPDRFLGFESIYRSLFDARSASLSQISLVIVLWISLENCISPGLELAASLIRVPKASWGKD